MDDFGCPALSTRAPLSSDDVKEMSLEDILAEADNADDSQPLDLS